MISDVQSIMGGDQSRDDSPLRLTAVPNKKAGPKKQENTFKRPEGMHRELFNLLSSGESKDISSIMPSNQIKAGYRAQKAQIGNRAVRRYKWAAFENQARTDGLKLFHWQREDSLNSAEPYIFARFNKVINIPTYTDEEYQKHLKTNKWSKEETDYLFEICRNFDLRWPIVHDRFDHTKFGTTRTIEDMKERFYAVSHEITQLRDPNSEPICYDAEHERKRKEQMCKQWERTSEELEEEEELMKQLKNIEVRKKERERKAQDLQKLITMTDAPCSPSVSGGMSPAIAKKKAGFRQKLGSLNGTSALANPADIESTKIRFPEFKTVGAHFRSHEMKLPTNVGQKKLNNIEAVLKACTMELNPMGKEEIVTAYNDFRSNVMVLQDLKAALHAAEFELESLKNKLSAEGKTLAIEPRMKIHALPPTGYDETTFVKEEGGPATLRRLAAAIDATNASGPGVARKRKTLLPANLTPIDTRKLRKS